MADAGPSLEEICYHDLLTKDPSHIENLLRACSTDGCFHLNLKDTAGGYLPLDILNKAERVIEVANEFFQLPLEQKLSWEMDKWGDMQIGGYKSVGKHSGASEGKRDGFENFLVPLDALLGLDSRHPAWPPPIKANLNLLKDFELTCRDIACNVLAALSYSLGPGLSIRFEDFHRQQKRSTTSLAMLKYPPSIALTSNQVGHMAHTDVGSVTLLFTSSPGLQVFRPHSDSWQAVTPRPQTIFVNVGDTLRFLSSSRFNSCLHRVVPFTGAWETSRTRYALAYFQRPELSAQFIDDEGRKWTGEGWHKTKYKIFRAEFQEQKRTSLLTGRAGFLGDWKEILEDK